ncbi:hypothetical protein AB0D27_26135 [Streptomyces sp. NPDC048415]|uniref:hypothetical protein n=1 Tax=Streptomyces sp. NPDC048415 TaxID=3154822 RepID=UPI003420C6A5
MHAEYAETSTLSISLLVPKSLSASSTAKPGSPSSTYWNPSDRQALAVVRCSIPVCCYYEPSLLLNGEVASENGDGRSWRTATGCRTPIRP